MAGELERFLLLPLEAEAEAAAAPLLMALLVLTVVDWVRNLADKLLRLALLSGEMCTSGCADTTVMSRVEDDGWRLAPAGAPSALLSPNDSKVLFKYESRRPTRSKLSELTIAVFSMKSAAAAATAASAAS